MMFSKILILAIVLRLSCEARNDVTNNLQKCPSNRMACIVLDFNRVIKATAHPSEKYNIQGYDTVKIEPFTLIRPFFRVDQTIDVTVTGFDNTTLLDIKKFGEKNGQKVFELEYEHNIAFSGQAKIVFHVGPDNDVIKEGPIAGKIVGLRSVFVAPVIFKERDGKHYYTIGKEQLLRVVMMNEPKLDSVSAMYFMGDEATSSIIEKMQSNKQFYYYDLVRNLVQGFGTRFFSENRKYFNNVPRTEFRRSEDEGADVDIAASISQ